MLQRYLVNLNHYFEAGASFCLGICLDEVCCEKDAHLKETPKDLETETISVIWKHCFENFHCPIVLDFQIDLLAHKMVCILILGKA